VHRDKRSQYQQDYYSFFHTLKFGVTIREEKIVPITAGLEQILINRKVHERGYRKKTCFAIRICLAGQSGNRTSLKQRKEK